MAAVVDMRLRQRSERNHLLLVRRRGFGARWSVPTAVPDAQIDETREGNKNDRSDGDANRDGYGVA